MHLAFRRKQDCATYANDHGTCSAVLERMSEEEMHLGHECLHLHSRRSHETAFVERRNGLEREVPQFEESQRLGFIRLTTFGF